LLFAESNADAARPERRSLKLTARRRHLSGGLQVAGPEIPLTNGIAWPGDLQPATLTSITAEHPAAQQARC